MRFLYIFFCFLISTSFIPKSGESFDFRKRAHVIARNAARPFEEKYRLRLIGTGGALFKDVKKIFLDYEIDQIVTKEEARKMTVEFVEQIAKAFNNDPEIQPYLHDHPFTFRNISFTIFVRENNHEVLHPSVGSFGTSFDGISYQTWYIDQGLIKLKTESIELYEEAKKIVESSLFNDEEN